MLQSHLYFVAKIVSFSLEVRCSSVELPGLPTVLPCLLFFQTSANVEEPASQRKCDVSGGSNTIAGIGAYSR